MQILERQSSSSHLRPKDGEGCLEVAAAERENGEEERRGWETGAGERVAGRERAGKKEREEAFAKECPRRNGLILGQVRGWHSQGEESGGRRLMREEGLEQA